MTDSIVNKDKMNEELTLGGNIALVGFNILGAAELSIIKKMVGSYVKKMCNKGEYLEMRLTLQQHAHGKSFKHEVNGLAIFKEGKFHSNVVDWNLFSAISQVCDKIMGELEHKKKREDEHKSR